MRGMGSLPLLPLALQEADVDPSLRMPKLRASVFRPSDILPCSPNDVNLFCRSSVVPLNVVAPPRSYGTVGGFGVPKLKLVAAMGTLVPTSGEISVVAVDHVPPAGFCWPLPPGGGCCCCGACVPWLLFAAHVPSFLHPC